MEKLKIITAIIADDHAFFREGLSLVLNASLNIKVVAEAANGKELVELAQQYQPDVSIVDIAMPVLNGIDAVKKLRIHNFSSVNMQDQLAQQPNSAETGIINLDNIIRAETHWAAYAIDPFGIVYLDSYGLAPTGIYAL